MTQNTTNVPPGATVVSMDELFRQKGELTTQMEIAQQKLQMVNQQISNILNSQPGILGAPKI